MKLLKVREAEWTPWKNGGGITRQLAAWPEPSGLDDFGWRISTARVEVAGPFSYFGGIDRSLVVLEGRLRVRQESHAEVLIGGDGAALCFDGEAAITAGPEGGAVLDFNVMTRRGQYTHVLRRHRLAASDHMWIAARSSGWFMVYVGDGQCRVQNNDQSSRLINGDAVLLGHHDGTARIDALEDTGLILVEIRHLD